MDIDWTKVREALKRIDRKLAEANRVIEATDATNEWPEVTRRQLEEAFPDWREEYGSDFRRDVLEKKVGRANFRIRPGSHKYRVAPRVLKELNIEIESTRGDGDSANG